MQRLAEEAGLAAWFDRADMFAGTSTGGLIALGLANGLSLDALRDLYEHRGTDIFHDSWLDNLLDIGKIRGAQYDTDSLARTLHDLLGQTTLADLQKHVLLTAFDLDNEAPDPAHRTWKPKIFHNVPGEENDGHELAYLVGLYTTAAPIFFPSVNGYIDGAIYANNPSMCAFAQTQDRRNTMRPHPSNVVMISFGTGMSNRFIPGTTHDWGYAQWARPLINIIFDGVAGIADYQCQHLMGEQYHRLAPVFPPGTSFALDDVRHIPDMVQFANHVDIGATATWLQKVWHMQR